MLKIHPICIVFFLISPLTAIAGSSNYITLPKPAPIFSAASKSNRLALPKPAPLFAAAKQSNRLALPKPVLLFAAAKKPNRRTLSKRIPTTAGTRKSNRASPKPPPPRFATARRTNEMTLPKPAPMKGKIIVGTVLGAFKQENTGTAYGILGDVGQSRPIGTLVYLPTDYQFVWKVKLGYLFPNKNDIILSYLKEAGRANGKISPGNDQDVKPILWPDDFNQDDSDSADSLLQCKIILAKTAFGHQFYLARKAFMLHPFLGVGYASVRLQQNTSYINLGAGTDQGDVQEINHFNGLGPLIGLDFAWHIGTYFSFIGGATWNGIIANLHQEYTAISSDASRDFYNFTGKSSSNILSLITYRLGLSINFTGRNMDTEIIFGYRATNIVNSSISTTFTGTMNETAVVNVLEDTAFQGPFGEVLFKFNVG